MVLNMYTTKKIGFILSLILLFVFCFPSISHVNATNSYQLLGTSTTDDIMQKWTITFNTKIDEKTVSDKSIYVLQESKRVSGFSLSVSSNKKSVTVVPPAKGYLYGKSYTIYIEDSIKSFTGHKMKQRLKYEFSVKELDYSQYDFDDYFEKVEWINRDGIASLSIYPKAYIVNILAGHDTVKHQQRSFDLLEERFSNDSRWKNIKSLEQQYVCHADFAGTGKVPWNIEPHRTTTNYRDVIIAKCNPK